MERRDLLATVAVELNAGHIASEFIGVENLPLLSPDLVEVRVNLQAATISPTAPHSKCFWQDVLHIALTILCRDKMAKNTKYAEPRYTAGTRPVEDPY